MNNRYQKVYLEWLIDILAYIVVLNLLTELFDVFYIYSFTVSILVAISIKLILVPIFFLKSKIGIFWKTKEGWPYKVLGLVSKFAILFSSKFIVLAYLDFKYKEYVSIEGFVSITILILLLMLTGKLLSYAYDCLGSIEPVNNA
ncbi:MAG: hypothetical protein ACQESO_04365 [Bacillota bacterium]